MSLRAYLVRQCRAYLSGVFVFALLSPSNSNTNTKELRNRIPDCDGHQHFITKLPPTTIRIRLTLEVMEIKKILARSTHRKSRKGCLECKRRRVKCDESKPECLNCTRRSLACYYNTATNTATTSSAASTPPISTEDNSSPEGPNLEDLQLWHHWLSEASSTFSEDASSLIMWRDNIPKLALKHRFVAQLLLALSALHLARSGGDECESYMARSTVLQTSAMSGMMEALAEEQSPNLSSALFVAAMVLCFCSLAKGPSPGQYLVYSDDGVPPWMDLLQGVKSINTQNRHAMTGITVEAEPEPGKPVNPEELFPGYSKSMEDLTQHIFVLRAEDQSFEKYTHSLEVLRTSFETAFERREDRMKTISHLILAWMYRIDQDFQIALQERRPMALVVLAHYMVIFAKLEDTWFVEGWARHIMNAVERDIHPAYARWLEWPALHLKC